MSSEQPPSRFDSLIWRLAPGHGSPVWLPRLVAGIWIACVLVGFAYALVQPVWSVVDEGPHFGYAELVGESFQFPKAGETLVSEQVLALGRDRQWGWQYPRDPSLSLEGDEAPVGTGRADESQWVRANLWRFNYEAIQPPLYYLVSAAVYRLTPGDALDRVYAIRMMSAMFASLNVLIAYRIARRVSPRSRILQVGAPASFVLLQGYMLNLSQITNDALAAPMGGLLILLMIAALQDGVMRHDALGMGLALGLAMLTKSVLWSMPFIITVVFVRCFGLRDAVRHLKWVAGVSALIFMPWLLRNLFVYGEATGQSTMSRFMGTFFPAPTFVGLREIWTYTWTATRHLVLSYAWGEPVWIWANRGANVIAVYGLLAVTAIGWARWIRHRRRIRAAGRHPSARDGGARRTDNGGPEEPARRIGENTKPIEIAPELEKPGMWICGLTFVVSYLFLLVLPLLGGIAVVGRYMYPVAAGIAVGVTFGAARAVPRPRLRIAFLGAIALLFLVLNVTNLIGWREIGLTTSRVADGVAYSNGARSPSTIWYFAGGRNEGGFTEHLSILNPGAAHTSVTISYYVGGGTVSKRSIELPGGETAVVNTRLDRAGGAGAGHLTMGTVVQADAPIVAERSEFFFVSDRGWNGGSLVAGRTQLVTEGYFAAGRVGDGWSEVLSILNTSEDTARVTIEYLADGRMREETVAIPARSPARVDLAAPDEGGIGERAERVSVRFRSAQPIAVERQLYRSGERYAGGDWAPSSMPSRSWTFPMIQSAPGYHPTLVLLNPSGAMTEAKLRYRFVDGQVDERSVAVAAGRSDIDLDIAAGPGLGVVGAPYALELEASAELVAELETAVRDSGYADVLAQPGVDVPSTNWYFAAGSTQPDFSQRVSVLNPSSQQAWIRLIYGPSRPADRPSVGWPAVEKAYRMAPGELLIIDVGSDPLGAGAYQDLSVEVRSDLPVFAGRALYFIHSF